MKDTFGRTINYARISVTDLCNYRCAYCMPFDGVKKQHHSSILRLEEIYNIVVALTELGVDKIRITGGEPLVRKGIMSLLENIGKLDAIKDFSITTNGSRLLEYGKPLKAAGIKRLNISLDTLNPTKYREITYNGDLRQTLEGIDFAYGLGFDKIKLNAVLVKGFNDDEILDFIEITKKVNIDVRFIELMPIGEQAEWTNGKYISLEEVLRQCPELTLVEGRKNSEPATYYKMPGAKGSVGLIRPISCKFCDSCNRIRITADGKIKTCLHSDEEIDIRRFADDKDRLKEAITEAINGKPEQHNLENGQVIKRGMSKIGG